MTDLPHLGYSCPQTVEAVLVALRRKGACIYAGGTDLLVQYQGGTRRPSAFVDVKRIPELMRIAADADGVTFVEREKVEAIIGLAEKKAADEATRIEGIRAGKQLSPAWLPKALADAEVTTEA